MGCVTLRPWNLWLLWELRGGHRAYPKVSGAEQKVSGTDSKVSQMSLKGPYHPMLPLLIIRVLSNMNRRVASHLCNSTGLQYPICPLLFPLCFFPLLFHLPAPKVPCCGLPSLAVALPLEITQPTKRNYENFANWWKLIKVQPWVPSRSSILIALLWRFSCVPWRFNF